MCYSIPGKVISIKKNRVILSYFGEEKEAIFEDLTLQIGDYVYAQAGFVIKRIEKKRAYGILNTFKETFFELSQKDLSLSKLSKEKKSLSPYFSNIIEKALVEQDLSKKEPSQIKRSRKNLSEQELTKKELLYLLKTDNREEIHLLLETANFLRQKYQRNSCCVHGIIEFSNFCQQQCHYCGLSAEHHSLKRKRLKPQELIKTSCDRVNLYGFQSLVLQSGEDPNFSVSSLCQIIQEIKKNVDVLIIISIGEKNKEDLKALYKAGARGLLLRFETSHPALYKKLHPSNDLSSRIKCLQKAYDMGFFLITGGLIGLPGQTDEMLLEDLFLAKELNAEMISFGPFLPHPHTPLKNDSAPSSEKVLKCLALSRLLDPREAKIVVTSAFETLDHKAREKGLLGGANSLMLNLTPKQMHPLYEIYPNRYQPSFQKQISETLMLLRSLGRAPTDIGISTRRS